MSLQDHCCEGARLFCREADVFAHVLHESACNSPLPSVDVCLL